MIGEIFRLDELPLEVLRTVNKKLIIIYVSCYFGIIMFAFLQFLSMIFLRYAIYLNFQISFILFPLQFQV